MERAIDGANVRERHHAVMITTIGLALTLVAVMVIVVVWVLVVAEICKKKTNR